MLSLRFSPSDSLPPINFAEWTMDPTGVALKSPLYHPGETIQLVKNQLQTKYPALTFFMQFMKETSEPYFSIRQIDFNVHCYRNYPDLAKRVIELWGSRFIRPDDKVVMIDNISDYNMRTSNYTKSELENKLNKTFDAAQKTLIAHPFPNWDKEGESDEDLPWGESINRAYAGFKAESVATGVRNLEIGITSAQGKRPYQEDRYAIDMVKIEGHTIPYFAIFDGHTGSVASQWVSDHIHAKLSDLLTDCLKVNDPHEQELRIYSALKTIFVTLGRELSSEKPEDISGSTAILALIIENKLWVANLGDSRAILTEDGTTRALSIDAELKTPKQQRSVWKRGQNVFISRGTKRVRDLNMSRAFHHCETLSGINPRTQIISYDLKSLKNDFPNLLLLGSDGLFDVGSSVQVGELADDMVLDKSSEDGIVVEKLSAKDISFELVGNALAANSPDNITVIVVKL